MNTCSLTHLGDRALERELAAAAARHRDTGAVLLAHLAEFDARRLYLPAAYPSMHAYCLGVLRFSEDAAFKRIRAARAARQFPAIFEMLADGRLHLSAAVLLAPHLTRENAESLLAAATHRSKAQVEQLVAERFPRPDVPAGIEPLALSCTGAGRAREPIGFRQLAPGPVAEPASGQVAPGPVLESASGQVAPGPVVRPGAALAAAPAPRAKLAPLAPERFALQVTIGQSTYEKLEHARALLGHQVAAGDLAAIVDRALEALVEKLEKQKFAATSKPRKQARRASRRPRHIPAEVKRQVWERDQVQCTFTSESGRRCPEKSRLEFDHADPVARGGTATVERVRLRCRAHNQYAAECAFGAGFMDEKRRDAQRARAAARAAKASAAAGALDHEASRGEPPSLEPFAH